MGKTVASPSPQAADDVPAREAAPRDPVAMPKMTLAGNYAAFKTGRCHSSMACRCREFGLNSPGGSLSSGVVRFPRHPEITPLKTDRVALL